MKGKDELIVPKSYPTAPVTAEFGRMRGSKWTRLSPRGFFAVDFHGHDDLLSWRSSNFSHLRISLLDVDKVGPGDSQVKSRVRRSERSKMLGELVSALATRHAAAYQNESQRVQSCIILHGCWAE
jgi:hypothetical protein